MLYKLLTEEQKKKIAKEYLLRRFVVMVWAVIVITLIGMVGFFPSYLLSESRQAQVAERTKLMGNLELNDEEREIKSWLADLNLKLRVLSPKRDIEKPSILIKAVVEKRVDGVSLTNFNWEKSSEGEVLILSGAARDRQALINFEQELINSAEFSEVKMPLSNLAQGKDIDFEVRLMLKNK